MFILTMVTNGVEETMNFNDNESDQMCEALGRYIKDNNVSQIQVTKVNTICSFVRPGK